MISGIPCIAGSLALSQDTLCSETLLAAITSKTLDGTTHTQNHSYRSQASMRSS